MKEFKRLKTTDIKKLNTSIVIDSITTKKKFTLNKYLECLYPSFRNNTLFRINHNYNRLITPKYDNC